MSRQANVRTDSHFSEPGFISVFAHNCEGPTALKYRLNSKRRHFLQGNHANRYQSRAGQIDNSNGDENDRGDIFKFHDTESYLTASIDNSFFLDEANEDPNYDDTENNSRTLFNDQEDSPDDDPNYKGWHNIDTNLDDAYSNEIENLFSKGVRGLLTSYMQKALQPAIKETLMESMGYKLSYG